MMKKLNKAKTATGLLAVALLVTLAGSCQKKDPGDGAAAQAAQPKEVDYSQHETFTFWMQADPNDYYSDYSENPMLWGLNRKFNVTLKADQPARGSEQDALSLMFGTGEYTDMIDLTSYSGSVNQLYEDGVIVNIADYLDYMPNYKRILDTNEGYRKASYNDQGQILTLRGVGDPKYWEYHHWGGLVYRHDILEAAANGNVQFPSGNDYPKTIGDWEYMLPLFKAHFEARGSAEYAPLILPSNGYIYFGR
jgi:putative aldouronate transport system substrate-binding protein